MHATRILSLSILAVALTTALGQQPTAPAGRPVPATGQEDSAKLTPLQEQVNLTARRGAEWMFRANRVDGKFVHGYLPALKTEMEGDHFLRQAGAAFALARAARATGDDRYAARATQAILTLLGETTVDPNDPGVRYTSAPPVLVNRLGAAGMLVLAVNELPSPQKDLLDQSEQLCNYIRKQQQPDGSLRYADPVPADQSLTQVPEGMNMYPGMALYGLMISQRHRPAPWKLEVVSKARPYYSAWWNDHKNPEFVPWQSAAYAEAFLLSKERAFAESVFAMNDWLCGLQYARFDPQHPLWQGGFMGTTPNGKPAMSMPDVRSAEYAEGLVDACRVAREMADLPRYQKYSDAAERCLQFLSTLQYTEGNTSHFANWYRAKLLGGFHLSEQDGNLRIDFSQHAVSAMFHYLVYIKKT